jgi:hypothetical protein
MNTPDNIKSLPLGSIFVFGSNEAGRHGAGAASLALGQFGAKYGMGFGPSGQSFAIPTKDWNLKTLPLRVIEFYVARFVAYAAKNPNFTFYVTKIGCGLAGYIPAEIAPMFRHAGKNVILPKEFQEQLELLI